MPLVSSRTFKRLNYTYSILIAKVHSHGPLKITIIQIYSAVQNFCSLLEMWGTLISNFALTVIESTQQMPLPKGKLLHVIEKSMKTVKALYHERFEPLKEHFLLIGRLHHHQSTSVFR